MKSDDGKFANHIHHYDRIYLNRRTELVGFQIQKRTDERMDVAFREDSRKPHTYWSIHVGRKEIWTWPKASRP